MRPQRNDPCSCGSGKKYKKCCLWKAEVHTSRQEAAKGATGRSALLISPSDDERARLSALLGARRLNELESRALLLLERYPDCGFIWSMLGIAFALQGKSSLHAMQKAADLMPEDAEAQNNLANVLQGLGRLDEAVTSYRRALAIRSNFAAAHSNLGNALRGLGQLGDAAASHRRALDSNPGFAAAHLGLANVLQDLGELDDAVSSYRRALELEPNSAATHVNLGIALKNVGDLTAAKASFRSAQAWGFNGASVHEALMLPAIMGVRQEVMKCRSEFERNLDRLMEKAEVLNDPLASMLQANFYLAFHGENDRDLQIKVAKFYEQACPSLLYTAPHCAQSKPESGNKIRIGFFSKFLYDHSVSKCYSKLIEAIVVDEQFEATLISERAIDEKLYTGFVGERVRLPYHLAQARARIAAIELDILVYLDVGMEPMSYFLAFSRLARVQCVLGGHPVTTGIANMDYFLSAELMEPPDADRHYSEKLVRLSNPAFYFERPRMPASLKTAWELGLPEGRHIYMCPMKLQKIHPDFDDAIDRILQLDVGAVMVLFEDHTYSHWKEVIANRFEKTISAEVRGRIIFLPWMQEEGDFICAVAAADVILDPFHFGIGSTAIATFAVGTPLVTRAGEFMRGRVGVALCVMMGLTECIAEDVDAYVQKAVQIAKNKSLRDSIRDKILRNNHVLFENPQPVAELVDLFCWLHRRAISGQSWQLDAGTWNTRGC